MTRVVSIYLPDQPTDRIRRADPSIPPEQPIAVIARSGSKRWFSAADPAARAAGAHVGMPAAKAQSLLRGLMMVDADPGADRVALERITLWALTIYSPIVAVDGIDGIVMDTQGADHLQGGELPMVTKIANQFLGRKLTARVAVADSWGAAHACARAITRETIVIPPGETVRTVERLPISLLRLPVKIISDLRILGFQTIGELANTPRAPLTLRFGPEVGRRLDQMLCRVSEPTEPIRTPALVEVPLFQESAMRVAMVCAGFTGGEADQLRKSMATFKFTGGVSRFKDKLVSGMVKNGYSSEFAEKTFRSSKGLAPTAFRKATRPLLR